MMMEFMKNAMLAGMGLAVVTKERADEMMKELTEKGKVSRDEAEKFVNELIEKSTEKQKEMKEYMQEYIDAYNKKVGIPTKKEFDALHDRVAALEAKLAESEKK